MEWKISHDLVPYEEALAFMEARVAAIRAGEAEECVWLLEHPPLYTAGTSAKAKDLVEAEQFPVFETGRGGQYTYHGPGQRVVYIMLDLKKRAIHSMSSRGLTAGSLNTDSAGNRDPAVKPRDDNAGPTPDIRRFVKQLEQLILQTLARFGVDGFTADERIGVWVKEESRVQSSEFSDALAREKNRGQQAESLVGVAPSRISQDESVSVGTLFQSAQPLGSSRSGSDHKIRESKIAALGIRVRHWVTFHGISINVNPNLSHFNGIIPCGISPQEYGVTSLYELGKEVPMAQLDEALRAEFNAVFGC